MLNVVGGGGCQCISFIFQLFSSNCMSISVSSFCFTKLCPAWNDVGNILRFHCALLKPPAECLLMPYTVWVVMIAWNSLVPIGKQKFPSEMLLGILFLIIQSLFHEGCSFCLLPNSSLPHTYLPKIPYISIHQKNAIQTCNNILFCYHGVILTLALCCSFTFNLFFISSENGRKR